MITIHVELYAQLQLFSYSSNQPLYHLQRERFVQPLIQSGTLLMSTPVQPIRFLTFKNWLKTELFKFLLLVTVFGAIAALSDSLAN